jgi:hypothetical protein
MVVERAKILEKKTIYNLENLPRVASRLEVFIQILSNAKAVILVR